jgi:hypothetical protein
VSGERTATGRAARRAERRCGEHQECRRGSQNDHTRKLVGSP